MAYVAGDKVSVRYGDSGRVLATIVDGPHDYTSWEMKKLAESKVKKGHSTARIPSTYYKATIEGGKVIRAPGGHIIRAVGA